MKRLTHKQFVEYVSIHHPCEAGLRWLKRQRSPGEAYKAAQRTPGRFVWCRWLIGEVFGHELLGVPEARALVTCSCNLNPEDVRRYFPWKRVAAEISKQIGARP